jgi:hypothetical protein
VIISFNANFVWLNYILRHEGTTSGKYEKEQLIHPKHFFIDSFVSIHFHCLLKFLLFSPLSWRINICIGRWTSFPTVNWHCYGYQLCLQQYFTYTKGENSKNFSKQWKWMQTHESMKKCLGWISCSFSYFSLVVPSYLLSLITFSQIKSCVNSLYKWIQYNYFFYNG